MTLAENVLNKGGRVELILGGARSGKSRFAETRAQQSALQVVYVATAQALDAEMQSRIAHHQSQRPADWMVVEEPIALAKVLQDYNSAEFCIVVDCLTLWLTNLLLQVSSEQYQSEVQALCELLPQLQSQVILVSNETGLGVVPMGDLSRRYVDEAGWLHQKLAQLAQRVVFCVAGLPMVLKGEQA